MCLKCVLPDVTSIGKLRIPIKAKIETKIILIYKTFLFINSLS